MDEARRKKNTPLLQNTQHGGRERETEREKEREREREREKNVSFPPPHLSPGGDVDRLPLWKHYSLTAPWQEFITAQPNVEIFSAKCQHM